MVRVMALSLLLLAASAHAKKPKKVNNPDVPTEDAPSAAPTGPPMVDIRCPYEAAAAHQFQITKITERKEPDQAPTGRDSVTLLDLAVLSSTSEQSSFELKYGQTRFGGKTDPASAEIATQLAAKMAGQPVRVALTHEPRTLKIDNMEALLAVMKSALDEVEAQLAGQEHALSPEVFAGIRSAFEDPALAEASIRTDLEPLFAFSCGSFPLSPTEYDTSLPNPLGGPDLPARGMIMASRLPYSVLAVDVEEVATDLRSALHVEISLSTGWLRTLERIRWTSATGADEIHTLRVSMVK